MSTLTVPDQVARWFEAGGETILGVLTRPVGPARGVGVIFLNGGHGGSSSGKNRIYRAWPPTWPRGYHSLRIEWQGIGDSTGAIDEYIMDEPFVDDALGEPRCCATRASGASSSTASASVPCTAIEAAERMPELEALYLVTLVLRDGALSEQQGQRMVSQLPTSEFVKRLGKLRHIGDAKRRKLYVTVVRNKVRQVLRSARYRTEGSKLARVSPQIVACLDDLGAGIPVHLVYGTSYWDPHKFDFEEVAAELKPCATPASTTRSSTR